MIFWFYRLLFNFFLLVFSPQASSLTQQQAKETVILKENEMILMKKKDYKRTGRMKIMIEAAFKSLKIVGFLEARNRKRV